MEKAITAVVTAVGGGGFGEQILKALRMAPRTYGIVGCDASPRSKGFARCDASYVLPLASDASYLSRVLAVCRRHEAKALFPGSEAELRVMSGARAAIEAAGLFCPMNPASVIDACLDKTRTMEAIRSLGFGCPRSVSVRAIEDVGRIDFLPAVLKPSVGGGGSAHAFIAQDEDELASLARYLLGFLPGFIAQEYVGTPDAEYTVGVLLSMDGELINSIAVHRFLTTALSVRVRVPNRTANRQLGEALVISSGISQGEVGRFPEVTQRCEALALALGCRGAVNMQCRLVNGEPTVFEINPRFSGTTSVRAMVGYNEPDVLMRRHLLGESIPVHFPYSCGVVLRGLDETLLQGPPPLRADELE